MPQTFTVTLTESTAEATLALLPRGKRWQVTVRRFTCEPNAEYLLQLFDCQRVHYANGQEWQGVLPVSNGDHDIHVGTASDLSTVAWKTIVPTYWTLLLEMQEL